jgi:DNA polymerase-3 subunit epsilon
MAVSINLTDLSILALDCQTTGANPDKGHLLEIGWISGRAAAPLTSEASGVQSRLIHLPPPITIPPAVQRITGISQAEMAADAVSAETAWQELLKTARKTALRQSGDPGDPYPTVIHFAGFEQPFLHQLHQTCDPKAAFPFQIICTHAIAKRLLPDLPRRGIRALAGYFGYSMTECRRSADHALATLAIWKAMVALLQNRCQIETLPQLIDWLAASRAPRRSKRRYPMDPKIRLRIPDAPGVYRMRRSNADVLYIGKAKSLKQRVNSYFRSKAAHPEHILEMLSQARDIDISIAGSVLAAATLESDEIKRLQPPYNKALRGDQPGLVFCTRDLRFRDNGCDRQFCIGPLPDGRTMDALRAFAVWLACGTQPAEADLARLGQMMLPPSRGQVPDIQCLKEGLHLFREKHRDRLRSCSALRMVTALGAQLWRRLRAARAYSPEEAQASIEDEESSGLEKEANQDGFILTPLAITDVLESMLIHSALLMRRARWYGLLSESSLSWTTTESADGMQHLVVLEGGSISHQTLQPGGRMVPVPSGWKRSRLERCNNLDRATYDRMRIVTTELRRILRQGRFLQIRLGPRTILTPHTLKKALCWV